MSRLDNPFPAFFFEVSISGLGSASFQECTGLSQEIDIEEYAEGGENSFVYRLPGRIKPGSIELKRGFTKDRELADWFEAVAFSTRALCRNLIISLLSGETGEAVASWAVFGAFPVKWSGPTFDAQSSSLALETVELAFQFFKRAE